MHKNLTGSQLKEWATAACVKNGSFRSDLPLKPCNRIWIYYAFLKNKSHYKVWDFRRNTNANLAYFCNFKQFSRQCQWSLSFKHYRWQQLFLETGKSQDINGIILHCLTSQYTNYKAILSELSPRKGDGKQYETGWQFQTERTSDLEIIQYSGS